MKKAERQIEQYEFALEIYNKLKGTNQEQNEIENNDDLYSVGKVVKGDKGKNFVQLKTLHIGQSVWHPLLGECSMENSRQFKGMNALYSELVVNVRIISLVPIRYECQFVSFA